MADTSITGLNAGATLHSDDWLVYVDTHDTSMSVNGTDKKLSPAVLLAGLGAGTVTTVSVASANGLAGTVANATTTPAITLSTTITGLLKGDGTAISAATANTDYQSPITLTTTGSSGAATFTGNTLNVPQYSGGNGTGTVTTVSVASANGLAGTVANATTTPAITLSTTITGLLKGDGTAISAATANTDYQSPITLTTTGSSGAATFTGNTLNVPQYSGGNGTGTVTTVSVASANGLAGTVANATTTPAITLSTTITGLLKGDGTAISAATANTDYQSPITLTTTGSSGAATFTGNTLNIPQYSGGNGGGSVTSVAMTGDGTVFASSVSGSPITTSGTLAPRWPPRRRTWSWPGRPRAMRRRRRSAPWPWRTCPRSRCPSAGPARPP